MSFKSKNLSFLFYSLLDLKNTEYRRMSTGETHLPFDLAVFIFSIAAGGFRHKIIYTKRGWGLQTFKQNRGHESYRYETIHRYNSRE